MGNDGSRDSDRHPRPTALLVRTLSLAAVCAFAIASALAAPPVVDAFTATPPVVAPGDVVHLVVDAHDPDCPDVCTSGCGVYVRADLTRWSATGGTFESTDNGTSGSPYTARTDWRAPDVEGVYTISVYLADSGSFFCGGRGTVEPTIDVTVTTSTDEPPVVDAVTATPPLLFPDQPATVTCTASDPEGGPLTYAWSADLGTVSPSTEPTATFTSSEPGLATVRCDVTDTAGLPGSGTTAVTVTTARADRAIRDRLSAPVRVDTDAGGRMYVVDVGGVAVFDLFTDRLLHRIPAPGATAVSVDWDGNLLLGFADGARVVDRHGETVRTLVPAPARVADVATDHARRRYGVVQEELAVVSVYDAAGSGVLSFGSTGSEPGRFRSPRGLAATADGGWVVADTGNHRVQSFDASGRWIRAFGTDGGGTGEFVRLDDVAVDAAGRIFASDAYQDWIQVFGPDGTPLETLGRYGDAVGELKTAAGIAFASDRERMLAASTNTPSIEVFRTGDLPPPPSPTPPTAALAPTSLVFAERAVGAPSDPRTTRLANDGGSTLGIERIDVSGDFLHASDCRGFLDPGESCSIDVTFLPTAPGDRRGTVVVTTTSDPPRIAAALTGTAFTPRPAVDLVPSLLTFGDRTVGTVSDPLPATLTNVGLADLVVGSVAVDPGFTESHDCPTVLAPGAGCTIEVRFAPTAVSDEVVGTLTVTTDAPDSPHAVALSGRSVPVVPDVAIGDWTGDEGDGEDVAASLAVTLSEPTTETVTVEFATVAGTAIADEDYLPTNGTVTFLPGETERAVVVTIVGDGLLEPDAETFEVELSNALGGTVVDRFGRVTVLDDEECIGPDLLVNPGAERRPVGADVPGWTQTSGSTWVRRGAPPPPVEGDWYFHAGTPSLTELTQDVDVGAFAAMIDAGRQWFAFEAHVRTLYEASPAARIVVEYRSEDNARVLDAFDSGDLASPAAWTHLRDARPAPAGTGWLRVRLIQFDPGDAYFDGLSLRSLRAATVRVEDLAAYELDDGFEPWSFRVLLACPFHEEVELDYVTRDGSAIAGEDYLANVGTTTIPRGDVETVVPVDVVGDTVDEYPDETFTVEVSVVGPSDAIALDPEGVGTIRNDDACALPATYWRNAVSDWPVTWLEIGGVEYGQDALLGLLSYEGSGAAHLLAKELVATELNLARGSDPWIRPTVEAADAFLALYPPGTAPVGEPGDRARRWTRELEEYNRLRCGVPPTGNTPFDPIDVRREETP